LLAICRTSCAATAIPHQRRPMPLRTPTPPRCFKQYGAAGVTCCRCPTAGAAQLPSEETAARWPGHARLSEHNGAVRPSPCGCGPRAGAPLRGFRRIAASCWTVGRSAGQAGASARSEKLPGVSDRHSGQALLAELRQAQKSASEILIRRSRDPGLQQGEGPTENCRSKLTDDAGSDPGPSSSPAARVYRRPAVPG